MVPLENPSFTNCGVLNVLAFCAMTEMAIQLTDGRVLASSETMYRIYAEHFDYDTEKDVTDIIGGVPEF